MAETVLVTGGNGFIAGWCIALLVERGYRVRTTVRSASKAPDGVQAFVADLSSDEGWDAACSGCDHVLHVASPLGIGKPESFIGPARDGTLRVLAAATRAGVKRVVMTSAAAAARPRKGVSDETVWADPRSREFDAYRRSKIIAERAAWNFMKGKQTQFATILPGAVFGPVLSKASLGSVAVIDGLLRGRPPGIPRIGFWIVDVRDLADLHIRAMTAPEAAGERFLAAGEFLWMAEIAAILRERFGKRATKVPKWQLPDALVRFLSLFVRQLRAITPLLGRKPEMSTAKARRMLGFSPRQAAETITGCAETLLGWRSWSAAGTPRSDW